MSVTWIPRPEGPPESHKYMSGMIRVLIDILDDERRADQMGEFRVVEEDASSPDWRAPLPARRRRQEESHIATVHADRFEWPSEAMFNRREVTLVARALHDSEWITPHDGTNPLLLNVPTDRTRPTERFFALLSLLLPKLHNLRTFVLKWDTDVDVDRSAPHGTFNPAMRRVLDQVLRDPRRSPLSRLQYITIDSISIEPVAPLLALPSVRELTLRNITRAHGTFHPWPSEIRKCRAWAIFVEQSQIDLDDVRWLAYGMAGPCVILYDIDSSEIVMDEEEDIEGVEMWQCAIKLDRDQANFGIRRIVYPDNAYDRLKPMLLRCVRISLTAEIAVREFARLVSLTQ